MFSDEEVMKGLVPRSFLGAAENVSLMDVTKGLTWLQNIAFA